LNRQPRRRPPHAHGGKSVAKKVSEGGEAFKEKNPKSTYVDKRREGVPKLLSGVSFCISRAVLICA